MAYCPKCGSMTGEGAAFCSICGASLTQPAVVEAAPAAQSAPMYQAPTPVPAPAQPTFTPPPAMQQPYRQTPDVAPMADEQRDIIENKIYAILSYFGIFVLIPIFAAPRSRFARFHANQGLLLCCIYAVEIIVTVLLSLIRVPKVSFIWGVPYSYRGTPWFVTLICILLWLVCVAFVVFGVVNAASGKYKKLPFIGELFTFLK